MVLAFFNAKAQEAYTSSTALPGSKYPMILKNRKVVLKVYAPKAEKVVLKGAEAITKNISTITKNTHGFWTVETSPIEIGFHYYWFEIDGKKALDEASQTYYAYDQLVNAVEVNSDENFFDAKKVPHGVVKKDSLQSKITNSTRSYYLYLPPNYQPQKKYPLLVLYHGAGEDETGWVKQGKIQNILDNLLAEKKIKPTLVLMDAGSTVLREAKNLDFETLAISQTKIIEEVLITELIPKLKSEYQLSKNYQIAGLSKGSFQALKIATDHPEIFKKVGVFSPVVYGGSMENPLKIMNKNAFNRFKSVFVGIGKEEKARYFNFRNILLEELSQHSVKVQSFESEKTDHEWLTWRRCLYQFLIWP